MACSGAGSYEQQRQAKKHFKKKFANRFKARFIAAWEKYGEFVDVNGERCFKLYRIDGDGAGQKRMSWVLGQPKLYEDVQDKHFESIKLAFDFTKLTNISDDDVDAFFTHYKNLSHNKNADKLHYKLEKVQNPDDYGYYTTDHVVTEHWFEKKIVTITQDADGNDVETITWEKIEGDDYLDELSWEIAYLALDSAVWFDPDTLEEITQIVKDEELDEAALDAKIDELRAVEGVGMIADGQKLYKVPAIGDKIREYTVAQSVGGNILDELEYLNYYGDDGTYYLSVRAAKRMRGEVFMALVSKSLDFRTELKDKYKWRKRLLAFVAIIASGVALALGQPEISASIMASYIGSVTTNKTVKILAQIAGVAFGGGAGGLGSMSASEAVNLIMNVAALYFAMKSENQLPQEREDDTDSDQKMFYQMPYEMYDQIYCYEDLISVSVE